jgi:hypothetical protein
VSERSFELGFLFTERVDVFFDQLLRRFGLWHVVVILSGDSKTKSVRPPYGARLR